MIQFIDIENKEFASAVELHQVLELNTTNYSRDAKEWVGEEYLFQNEKELRQPCDGLDFYSPELIKKLNFDLAIFINNGQNEYSPHTASINQEYSSHTKSINQFRTAESIDHNTVQRLKQANN